MADGYTMESQARRTMNLKAVYLAKVIQADRWQLCSVKPDLSEIKQVARQITVDTAFNGRVRNTAHNQALKHHKVGSAGCGSNRSFILQISCLLLMDTCIHCWTNVLVKDTNGVVNDISLLWTDLKSHGIQKGWGWQQMLHI